MRIAEFNIFTETFKDPLILPDYLDDYLKKFLNNDERSIEIADQYSRVQGIFLGSFSAR